MISIIKNGKEKTYYARCYECGTEVNYAFDDVKDDTSSATRRVDRRFIVCPVCGNGITVDLSTEEEMKQRNNLFGWGFGNR